MDEILIEEKKYVSSKQAAKITGYAKDYVGQLCREGRVPARLVGRSWYVLESAIADHRFGNPEGSKAIPETKEPVPAVAKTWEFPRYETAPIEVLPSVNRFNEEKSTLVVSHEDETEENREEAPQASPSVHDSWKEWFDHIASTTPAPQTEHTAPTTPAFDITTIVPEGPREAGKSEREPEEAVAVNVPLRVVSDYFEPEELLQVENQIPEEVQRKNGSRVMVRAIQFVGVLVAILFVALSILGSGYFDAYSISSSQAHIFSGISVYNK